MTIFNTLKPRSEGKNKYITTAAITFFISKLFKNTKFYVSKDKLITNVSSSLE